MLGTLQAVGDDTVVSRFRTRRVALLLAHLALHQGRAYSRDEIGEILWPEKDPEVIRRNLRQALTSLRHALEPPSLPPGSIVVGQQSRIQLSPELVKTDVAEFEALIEEARRKPVEERSPLLRSAFELYKGPLLPGYDEDDWIASERMRLEDLFVFTLRQLIDDARQRGQADEAIQYLRRALEIESFNEEWHIALMRAYVAAGRPSAAVKQFDELKQQLSVHLDCEPSHAAVRLLHQARQAAGEVAESPPFDSPVLPSTTADDAKAEPVEPATTTVRLPVLINRFCGRQEEVEHTLDHVVKRQARLTTLMGPAGTGKTRLSIEAGRRLAATDAWNVWFVPLADLSSASMVYDAILDALKARRSTHHLPIDQLREALRGRENNLLILDNLEHLIEETAPLIQEILDRVPEVQLLVTSRQILRLSYEHQIEVPPLPVPEGGPHIHPMERDELTRMADYPSVQLFVDRCQAIRPDFQLTPHNARAIAAICAKLDGVPLAIELAAGLSGSFAPTQMVAHLQKRLTDLTSRRRDLPERHRSLRAAIDYSYDTLSPDLQRFFASLSVFRGAVTVEAAYEICFRDRFEPEALGPGVRRQPDDACLDLILELQERSLLRSETAEGVPELCFRMLESFREYGEEHLAESEYRELRARHLAFFRSQPAKTAYPLSTEERTRRHLWIEYEYDNYVAAIDYAIGEGDFEAGIALLETLATAWTSRGPRGIERHLIRQIADRSENVSIDPAARIMLLRMLGTTYIRSAEYLAAYRACEVALGVAEGTGSPIQIAICHLALATASGYLGNLDECQVHSLRAIDLLPEDSYANRARAFQGIGAVAWGRGQSAEAEGAFLRAAEYSAKARGGEPDTLILYNLARVCLDEGRYDEAMIRLGEGMRISQRLHDEFGMATCLTLVSRYHWKKGQLAAAIATNHEAILKHRDADFLQWSLLGIFQHALVLTDLGEWEAAAMLLASTQGVGKAARLPDERDQEAATKKIRAHLSEAAFERAWARGLTMDAEEAFRLALRFK